MGDDFPDVTKLYLVCVGLEVLHELLLDQLARADIYLVGFYYDKDAN